MAVALQGGSGAPTAAQSIWNYLTGTLGLTPTAAAGVEGNLAQESSLNPLEPGGGLAQWGGSRWTGLQTYASTHGLDPNSMDAQLGFLAQEINTGSGFAFGGSKTGLNNQSTPGAAADYFSNTFERPSLPMLGNREAYAQNYYNEFALGLPPSSAVPQGGAYAGLIPTSGSVGQGTDAFLQSLNNDMQVGPFGLLNGGNWEAAGFRIFFFLLALMLVMVGLIKLIGASNITNAAMLAAK